MYKSCMLLYTLKNLFQFPLGLHVEIFPAFPFYRILIVGPKNGELKELQTARKVSVRMANYCPTCGVNYTAREHHCVEKKICRTCGQEKPMASFPVHASSCDGHKHDCTICYEAMKQQVKVRQVESRSQIQRQKEQRAQENRLFDAYGYRWKKEWRTDGWGYSPFPLAKRLADGTIEVTTYHFEGEWRTTLYKTEEDVVDHLYSDGDGTWNPGKWTQPA